MTEIKPPDPKRPSADDRVSMPMFAMRDLDRPVHNAIYSGEYDNQHGQYLAASGTLTQFNSVMVALLSALLVANTEPTTRALCAGALLLHILAAFILVWAARPVQRRQRQKMMSLHEVHNLTDDTLRFYRRGWRVTVLGMAVSIATLILYLEQLTGLGQMLLRKFGQ